VTERALIIGGTGQIGRAVGDRLEQDGWEVTAAHRGTASDAPALDRRTVLLDRDDDAAVRGAAEGVDLLVDVVAYTPAHARLLLGLDGVIGSVVAMSTGSVYAGLNGTHYGSPVGSEPPVFPVPLVETSPTISADDGSYGALKAGMERVLLASQGLPVSVLRLGSVHGPYSSKLREWYFIKRLLDGRTDVVLARNGRGQFSTLSTINLAELVKVCASRPGTRVLNAVDEAQLTLAQKAAAISEVMDAPLRVHAFEGPPRGELGADPWDQAHPFVNSMDAARALGYVEPVDYRRAVAVDLAWLLPELGRRQAMGGSWIDVFPRVERRYGLHGWFRYDLEDAWLSDRSTGG
jgi:nucleoside-diphosphate-sugar epimerase